MSIKIINSVLFLFKKSLYLIIRIILTHWILPEKNSVDSFSNLMLFDHFISLTYQFNPKLINYEAYFTILGKTYTQK